MKQAGLKRLLGAAMVLAILAGCQGASKHYREIASPITPYIAKIRTDRMESAVVVYNSDICERIGAACGFFRSHAYAHYQLNHQLLRPENYPESFILEADCWAARNADPEEVVAAVRLLEDETRRRDLPIYGDPDRRAAHIRDCAARVGNWPHAAAA